MHLLIVHLRSGQIGPPPGTPLDLPLLRSLFQLLKSAIFYFPSSSFKGFSVSPPLFSCWTGRDNQDCVGLPAKARSCKLAGKEACFGLPNGECY